MHFFFVYQCVQHFNYVADVVGR